jgi:hypothetical protein
VARAVAKGVTENKSGRQKDQQLRRLGSGTFDHPVALAPAAHPHAAMFTTADKSIGIACYVTLAPLVPSPDAVQQTPEFLYHCRPVDILTGPPNIIALEKKRDISTSFGLRRRGPLIQTFPRRDGPGHPHPDRRSGRRHSLISIGGVQTGRLRLVYRSQAIRAGDYL